MIDENRLIEYIETNLVCVGNEQEKRTVRNVQELIYRMIKQQQKVNEWIPVEERLPEEHDSIFAKLKGTDKWNKAMFEKISDDVNVTIEFDDGIRKTITMHTRDGKWSIRNTFKHFDVIAWQPLPNPYVKE